MGNKAREMIKLGHTSDSVEDLNTGCLKKFAVILRTVHC